MVGLLAGVTAMVYNSTNHVNFFRLQSQALEAQLVALTNLRAQVRNQLLETYEVAFVEGFLGHAADIENEKNQVALRFSELETILKNQNIPLYTQKIHEEYEKVDADLDEALKLESKGLLGKAQKLILKTREEKFNRGFITAITEVINAQKAKNKTASKNLESSILDLQKGLIILTFFAIILAGALIVFILNSIGRRLSLIEAATQKIAIGEYDVSIPDKGNDELAYLSKAFNEMATALVQTRDKVLQQQTIITQASKMSALGEMAGGVAHEINTPLAIIRMRIEQLEDSIKEMNFDALEFMNSLEVVRLTVDRIAKIISGLRFFARDGSRLAKQKTKVSEIIEDTLSFCNEKFMSYGVKLEVNRNEIYQLAEVHCQPIEISQVLLNILNNSFDAITSAENRWIRIAVADQNEFIEISIADSGHGIPSEVRDKIMQPFFTTKDIGKGTGLGLSISTGIMEAHKGKLIIDPDSANTCFKILLPKDLNVN